MSNEQACLPAFSPAGTCDVGRRIVFGGSSGSDAQQETLLDQASIAWDAAALERCFGWPAELVDAASSWWTARIHPDDRLRAVSSLQRALVDSPAARYWSESYRFRVYDGGAPAALDGSIRPPPSPWSHLQSAPMISSGDSRSSDTTPTEATAAAPGMHAEPPVCPSSASRSPTPRQSAQLARPPSPAPSRVPDSQPERDIENKNENKNGRPASAGGVDDGQYITVLDQLFISRQSRTSPSPASPDERLQAGLPTSAVGAMFALEQRVKTAEALQNPRSMLMRSISNLSAGSNASSSATSGTASSSTGSYASVPSSAGAMQRRASHQQQQHIQYTPPSSQLHPLSLHRSPSHHLDNATPPAASNLAYSPTSPATSPSGTSRAFSFLDVEGVRTILENTQSGLTMVDAKGRPTYFNAAGAAITGYANLDDLRTAGKDLHAALHHSHPDGRAYPASDCPIVRSMATLTRLSNQEDIFFRKDGTPFPVVWSCSPISKLGRSIGAVLEFRDVTEEKALEKEKIKVTLMNKHQEITIREANASKQRMTQFLDYIAHELRNPLHGIAANIEFLRDSLTALQLAYNSMNTNLQRPGASPLQPAESVTTPSGGASGSLLSTNSQSSSLRSSSATSSFSSQHSISHGALRAMSPRLDHSSPRSAGPAIVPSSSIPSTEISSPVVSPPAAAQSQPPIRPTQGDRPSSEEGQSQTPTPKGMVLLDQFTEDKLRHSLTKAQASSPPAANNSTLPKSSSGSSQDKLSTPSKQIVDTITSIDDAAQKQFKAHFEHSASRGPPPWQTEEKNSLDNTGGAMAMSPLLADIAKHTATASSLAQKQADLNNRRSSVQPASNVISPSTQGGNSTRKTLPTQPGASKEDLRSTSPASPSLSSATILESEADTEAPHLSTTEIQQVLQTSQSFITSIRECVFHATHITNNVLDLSRFEAGKVELLNDIVYPARVASLAVDMMMARAQEKEIELRLDIPEDQTLVRGDGTRLAQVFLNLLSNAIKFTPRGGQVTLRFRVAYEGGRVLLTGSIIDTGMGMSKAEMSNLFQRFGQSSRAIQAEYGGTGLGLSICQEIVSLQGGKMSVESEKGKGSTFSFTAYYQSASQEDVKEYLRKTPGTSRRGSVSPVSPPVSEPGEPSTAAAINAFIPSVTNTITGQTSPSALPEDQQARLRTLKSQLEAEQADREVFKFKHILVAEDNGINQNIMKNYLKKLGYQYTIVNNGQEVLDTFVNKSHDTPIDVILMDCEMPVMDGRQATEHIRQHEHFRKNLVTPLDSPFNLQLGAAEINNLQATPPSNVTSISYSPPLASPTSSLGSGSRRLHRTPIIGLSGNARQELVNQALASGMDDYVVKPFKLAELEKVLKKWENTIDEQLVNRSIAMKAKEFLASTAASGSPARRKMSMQSENAQRVKHWARARSGSSSSKSDTAVSEGTGSSSSSGATGSPKPIRPPLLSSLSASRLPREHMLGYGTSERPMSRPKLPSRLSNEWVQRNSQPENTSAEQSYSFPPARPRMPTIASGNSSPADMSPLPESPAHSPAAVNASAPALAPSPLLGDETKAQSEHPQSHKNNISTQF